MLKKKNIAMMTAAVAVATSVMPAFADVDTTTVDEATMIAEVQKMLNTKYTDRNVTGDPLLNDAAKPGNEYQNSVYSIKAGDEDVDVKSINDLQKMIEKAKVDGKTLTLTIIDKGHTTENGVVVDKTYTKNRYYEGSTTSSATAAVAPSTTNAIILDNLRADVYTKAGETDVKITLANGKVVTIDNGDLQLDFTKPVDADGNRIDVTTAPETKVDVDVAKKVVGFELYEDANKMNIDIASKKLSKLEFNAIATNQVVKAEDLYNSKTGYTSDGIDFVKDVKDALAASITSPAVFVKNGVKYHVVASTPSSVEVNKDGGYKFDIELKVANAKEDMPKANNAKITVTGAAEKDLKKIWNDIKAGSAASSEYVELSGDDRFETAVEISKANFHAKGENATASSIAGVNTTTAKSIVLVGENAIVDGLAAAPLAAQKQAPILLTKKDSVPSNVMDEIKRVAGDDKVEVYLIGGSNTISSKVESQLIKDLNANITRLDGADRYATSLSIADELVDGTNKDTVGKTAYVVGGTGMADAMSVASFAANATTQAPIIVTPKEGLTKDAKNFIDDNKFIEHVKAIGGESHISTQVLKDAEAARKTGKVDTHRISGSDRNDTNAKVIEELAPSTSYSTVYVAKDGDAQLVDALAAAPLAGRTSGAIVLATNNLTEDQEDAIKDHATKSVGDSLVQVGGGIGQNVLEKLLDALQIKVSRFFK